MTKFWRRLHWLATVIAGLFIVLASVTGIILAVEPWFHSQNAVSGSLSSSLTLGDFQKKLSENVLEVFSLERDAYGNLKVEGVGVEKEGTLYLHSATGQIVNAPTSLSPIFDFSRDLHRSLFLKTPGRILMGLASLALVFLVVSGVGLQIKRAGRLKAVLKPIKILEIKRDGHAQWSRLLLVPILILALSGVYLSVVRFTPAPPNVVVFPSESIQLENILLSEVKKVTYPIAEGEPIVVELADKILHYESAQKRLVKVEILPLSEQLRNITFVLHTGEGTIYWAGGLFLTALVLLFLCITGFQMITEKWVIRKRTLPLGDDTNFLILVGSETGHTWRFANVLANAFLQKGLKVSVIGMENLPSLTTPKTLLFLTSTYGDGDAPENAVDFIPSLATKLASASTISYGVLGFGSSQYPAFCAYAEQLHRHLKLLTTTQEAVPYMTVDNQSVAQFLDWVKVLNKRQRLDLTIDTTQLKPARKKGLVTFTIIDKKEVGETFLLKITYAAPFQIQSGDLLGVYPPNEPIERFYSIAALSPNELLLVIKRTGLCSRFLGSLSVGEHFEAYLKPNPSFHFPSSDNPLLMIANGTGIAPFLGNYSSQSHLFWGGKTSTDFELFADWVTTKKCSLAFSQVSPKAYVQDLIQPQQAEIAELLKNNGVIMVCGSLTMLSSVQHQLEPLLSALELPSLKELKQQGRFLADCY